jgi:hypothetical protein
MGMICFLRSVSEGDLGRLLREPDLIHVFLHGEEEFAAPAPEPARGFFARLFGRATAPPDASAPALPTAPAPAWSPRTDGDEVDLDKAWHALHYFFTGTPWEADEPGGYLLEGGEPIGDVDVGYGPARALRPPQVERFAKFLEAFDREDLLDRYDPPRMKALDIYPNTWGDAEDLDEFEYLWASFKVLREFTAAAARRKDGVVLYIG